MELGSTIRYSHFTCSGFRVTTIHRILEDDANDPSLFLCKYWDLKKVYFKDVIVVAEPVRNSTQVNVM